MKPRLKISTADWPEAVCLVAFLLLSLFIVPHAPVFIKVAFGLLVAVGAFWTAASALHERWRAPKTAGSFLGYYLRLAVIGVGIVLAWLLLVLVAMKLFLT